MGIHWGRHDQWGILYLELVSCLCSSLFLSPFLFVVSSLKANLGIGVAEFYVRFFPFSLLVSLWVFNTTCVFLEKSPRGEELVFEISVLQFPVSLPLSSSLLVVSSLKANLGIGVVGFYVRFFPFSLLVSLWVFNTTCVFLERSSRGEELVFEISVLQHVTTDARQK